MTFKNTAIAFVALLALCSMAFGQANLTSTTLSAAVNATTNRITVASATGISAPGVPEGGIGTPTGTAYTVLFVDNEAMDVLSVSGTTVIVRRGQRGTGADTHANAAKVWLGPANYFSLAEPHINSSCTAANLTVLPRIIPKTGAVWNCVGGLWTKENREDIGTPGTGVVAVELGQGRNHVTRLTFTGQTIGSPTGAVNLAFGKLVYTLPAGAAIVKSSLISVALTCTGAVVTADTPDTGLGTTLASGANAVLSGNALFENIMTGQTSNDVNGTVELAMVSNSLLNVAAADNHTVYLNVGDGWAGADTVVGAGTIILEWVSLH